jgi:hypothetical protein
VGLQWGARLLPTAVATRAYRPAVVFCALGEPRIPDHDWAGRTLMPGYPPPEASHHCSAELRVRCRTVRPQTVGGLTGFARDTDRDFNQARGECRSHGADSGAIGRGREVLGRLDRTSSPETSHRIEFSLWSLQKSR